MELIDDIINFISKFSGIIDLFKTMGILILSNHFFTCIYFSIKMDLVQYNNLDWLNTSNYSGDVNKLSI